MLPDIPSGTYPEGATNSQDLSLEVEGWQGPTLRFHSEQGRQGLPFIFPQPLARFLRKYISTSEGHQQFLHCSKVTTRKIQVQCSFSKIV